MLIFIRGNVGIERGRGDNGQKRLQTQHYRPHPSTYRPHPQPLSKGRGEGYALCIDHLLLVNLLSTSLTSLPTGLNNPPSGLTSTPTGLTPNPSPRGEGSDMPCALTTCYWLACQLGNWLTRQLSNHSPTSQTLVNGLTS